MKLKMKKRKSVLYKAKAGKALKRSTSSVKRQKMVVDREIVTVTDDASPRVTLETDTLKQTTRATNPLKQMGIVKPQRMVVEREVETVTNEASPPVALPTQTTRAMKEMAIEKRKEPKDLQKVLLSTSNDPRSLHPSPELPSLIRLNDTFLKEMPRIQEAWKAFMEAQDEADRVRKDADTRTAAANERIYAAKLQYLQAVQEVIGVASTFLGQNHQNQRNGANKNGYCNVE